jgi:hypothetical protein
MGTVRCPGGYPINREKAMTEMTGWRSSMAGVGGLSVAMLLVLATTGAAAEPRPLTDEEKAKINAAIDRGIDFLKQSQRKDGTWTPLSGQLYGIPGYTLMPALALLECGVPPDDEHIQRVARQLRRVAHELDGTYEISLAILVLDKLGDPQDKKLLQTLAVRLIASQSAAGGWSYKCLKPSEKTEEAILATLRRLEVAEGGAKESDIPAGLKRLVVFREPDKLSWRESQQVDAWSIRHVDNSNTQFALLALWAARRHGIPVQRTFRLAVHRFETSQLPDGTWHYFYQPVGPSRHPDPRWRAMTPVGLLGLALKHGMQDPGGKGQQAVRAELIEKGFAALSTDIGEPTGQMSERVPQLDLYFLWSVERVGTLYGLPRIGEKDWYRWGAEILVTNQNNRGFWPPTDPSRVDRKVGMSTYGPVVNTAFALLFLKRVNLTPELTARLPFKPEELNKGIRNRLHTGPVGPDSPSPGQARKQQ